MGQSLVKNYVHLVFSTKHREPWIYPPYDNELYSYIAGICRNMDCNPVVVGGYSDHIHILCSLSRKVPLMNLICEIKARSSKWIKAKDPLLRFFRWQNGYGAFSVNPVKMDRLINYINDQYEHHHRKKGFQKEFRKLLIKHKIKFEEAYVWD